ncbi:MAG TPA: hypothetical protein VGG10_08530 [Rhizomicrobium sp.]|jgi:hypothetical protein
MATAGYDNNEPIRKRSGWLIPLAVFIVTFALSAAILVYYLAPRPSSFAGEQPSVTSRTDPVSLRVHGLNLSVPANYIVYESAREGGERTDLAMEAAMPDYRGYAAKDAAIFASNAADSQVVYLLLREEKLNFSEADRLKRIYMNYVAEPNGSEGPFGLTQYAFRDDSGYHAEDLFVGTTPKGLVVMRCVRFSQSVSNPSCLRDVQIAHGVALTYRFKRAYLSHWREIASGVENLIHGFIAKAKV